MRLIRETIKRLYGLEIWTQLGTPKRITHRPTGGAYVSIGWQVRGRGERIVGWVVDGAEASPRWESRSGTWFFGDDDL